MKRSSHETDGRHRLHRVLGDILVEAGTLKPADRLRVLAQQALDRAPFGQVALRLGLIGEIDLREALAQQFNFPYLRSPVGDGAAAGDLPTATDPFGAAAEAFRALRNQLSLRWLNGAAGRNVLAVASPDIGDGRSHVAANLAVQFAQAGETTLLVDASLRRPRLATCFGHAERGGLSEYLQGGTGCEPVVAIAGLPGLYLLPAGEPPLNPSELLASRRCKRLLAACGGAFDVVVIDTPALGEGAGGLVVAARAGSALVIARQNATRVRRHARVLRALANAHVHVAGTLLNGGQELV